MEEIATKGMYYRKDWLGRDSDHHTGEMTSEYGERRWEWSLPTRASTIRTGQVEHEWEAGRAETERLKGLDESREIPTPGQRSSQEKDKRGLSALLR